MKNIAIIGSGASGLACAIMLKSKMPALDVTIYEANDRVGKKIAITGNGRCNISNSNASLNNYHGDSMLAQKLLDDFDFEKQCEFFNELGVIITKELDGKAYPLSYQASSVVDALRFSVEELNINLKLSCPVSSVEKNKNGGFIVTSKAEQKEFSAVVVATGGKAGGKIASDSGYLLLKKLGHKIENLFPAIVQIKTETELVKQLKGIKINGNITIKSGQNARTEYGEILFCDYGLSGPPVLQVSRLANLENPIITLDLLPSMDKSELISVLKSRIALHPRRPVSELFTGFLNKRLGQVVCKSINISINQPCTNISNENIVAIANKIKAFDLKAKGTTGFDNAQVTAGGAQTSQFFDNLMSKKVKGLFAAGEVLNVDGDCGGYNLAFAWASANTVANSAIEYLKGL